MLRNAQNPQNVLKRMLVYILVTPPLVLLVQHLLDQTQITVYVLGRVTLVVIAQAFFVFVARKQILKLDQFKSKLIKERERFFHMMTHDLKTPLNALQMSVTLLMGETKDKPPDQSLLDIIKRSTGHMVQLIDDLANLVSLQTHRMHLHCDFCNPHNTVEEVLMLFATVVKNKKLRVVQKIECRWVMADRFRLKQILINLIGNAIKYTPPGGQIIVTCQNRGSETVMSVHDSGRGIPEDKLKQIFEPYVQVHESDSTKGWGLGLAIVKGLVEAHGGKIWAESSQGQGTTFSFTLPSNPTTTGKCPAPG